MKYSLGLRGHDIADDFDQMCLKAYEKGIKNLQFALAKTMSDVDFDKVGYDAALSDKIGEKLTANDLHISVLGCYISPVHENADVLKMHLKRFENFLCYAKDFGADVTGTETGMMETSEKTRSEENYRSFSDNMRPLLKRAEMLGVNVGIEPVCSHTIWSPQVMRRFIDDMNSDSLKVILDVSNMIDMSNRDGQRDIINESFDLFGDKIAVLHLKDYTFDSQGRKTFAQIGTGELMKELIFERMTELENPPGIILDETKAELYEESIKALGGLICD